MKAYLWKAKCGGVQFTNVACTNEKIYRKEGFAGCFMATNFAWQVQSLYNPRAA